MENHKTLAEISHYKWMLENLDLAELHRSWIIKQIESLTASLELDAPIPYTLTDKGAQHV